MKLFLSPHNDDEALFGALTIAAHYPTVCVVFDSYVQVSRGFTSCGAGDRRAETLSALLELTDGNSEAHFLGFHDDEPVHAETIAKCLLACYPAVDRVWAPALEPDGHDQHNAVSLAAHLAFPGKISFYSTYTRVRGKSRLGSEVRPLCGEDIARKLRALACYKSQLAMEPKLGCWPHFMRDLTEYML